MAQRWIDQVGIRIDRDADVPVGVQLDWALGRAIRAGALGPGDRLPPLRELAEEVGVNPNTLRAVYARLEAAGLIKARHGSGTFVTGRPGAEDLDGLVASVSKAARDAGLAPRELAAALYVTPERPRDPEAAQRQALREEIAVLERVLATLPRQPAKASGDRGPRLLDLDALRNSRDDLVARIGAATRPAASEAPSPSPAAKAKPARAKTGAKRRPRLGPAPA